MTTRWLWSVGAFVLVAAVSSRSAFAQGDGPRAHWKEFLTDTNVVSLTYIRASGNVNPNDPTLTVLPGARFDMDLLLLGYSRTFALFDRTAVGSVFVAVGALEGAIGPVQDSARGFGDPGLQLDVNLIGAPAMRRMPDLLRYEPAFTLDVVVNLGIPIGEYDGNSPTNIGQNRWYGRVGAPIMISLTDWVPRSKTTLEFLPAVWFFGDNGNFLGQTVENDPLFQLEAHLTRNFTEAFWGSLDAVWYWGGEATIGGVSGQELNDLAVGFTLGYEINDNMLLTVGYVVTVGGGQGDLDLGAFRINLVFGWHALVEGIKRLGD